MSAEIIKVVRPKNPALALEFIEFIRRLHHAGKISRDEQCSAFGGMLYLQPYTFIGFLSGQKVVDADGKLLGDLQKGDSFITEP